MVKDDFYLVNLYKKRDFLKKNHKFGVKEVYRR